MNRGLLALGILVLLVGGAQRAGAHCEIPCGIYGDEMRFDLMAEHITTIEKSMNEIRRLAAKDDKTAQDHNQLARWIVNKEQHAGKLQEVVSQYFLHQRIKPAPAAEKKARRKYIRQLTAAHALLIGAMRAKQTVAAGVIADLERDLKKLRRAYFGPQGPGHDH